MNAVLLYLYIIYVLKLVIYFGFAGFTLHNEWLLSEVNNFTEIQQTATADKRYICDICDKKYSDYSHLTRHKRNIHGPDARPFPCPHCTAVLKNKNSLQSHVYMTHTKKR
jgi:uncharacterized Zn-finger protein